MVLKLPWFAAVPARDSGNMTKIAASLFVAVPNILKLLQVVSGMTKEDLFGN